MEQPAAPHVVDGAGGHRLLVAEHHRLEHLAYRRAQAAADVAAGREAQAVDKATQAAAAAGEAQRGERRGEHDVLAAPLEVAPVVELARLGLRQRFDLRRRQAQARAFDERPERGEGRRRRAAQVERERRPLGDRDAVDRGDLDVERDALVAGLGQRERRRLQRDRVTDEAGEMALRLRVEARGAHDEAGGHDERRQGDRGRSAQAAAPGRDLDTATTGQRPRAALGRT